LSRATLIAIIDDDAALRVALHELLAVFDFECQAFPDAAAFLSAWTPLQFACVISDLNMPGMDGLALVQHLRAAEPALPVILISAQIDPAIRARALRAGAIAYLGKPIDDSVLHRHLIAALNRQS
jgi:FixJ family two-component response regulator